jgi:hypothetical protein
MLEKDKARSGDAKPKNVKTKAAQKAAGATRRAAARRPREDVHERIRRRAYELWESEGRPEGRQHAHWYQAEMEITRARTRASL